MMMVLAKVVSSGRGADGGEVDFWGTPTIECEGGSGFNLSIFVISHLMSVKNRKVGKEV